MRRLVAHPAQVVQGPDDAPPEVVVPDPVGHDPRRQRVVARRDPLGQRQAAAGGAPVGARNLRRRIAVGGRGQEARRHRRAGAERVAADQEVVGRRLVGGPPFLVQVGAVDLGRRPAFRTADHLVARAVRGEAVVAVGDDVRHRRGGRPFVLERRDLRAQLVHPRLVLRAQRLGHLRAGRVDGEHLHGEELLAGGALGLRLEGRRLHVLREPLPDHRGAELFAVRRLDRVHLVAQRLLPVVDVPHRREVGVRLVAVQQRVVDLDVAVDRRLHAVVVLLQDRVELVVVAAGAVDGHAENAAADRGQHVVQIVVPALRVVLLAEVDARAGAQEAGGDARLVRHVVQLVARDLLAQELVVRLVVVERVDDVVAVAPHVQADVVLLEPVGVGVARHVQPVAAPALAVVGRIEQLVDEPLPGAALGVGQERLHLLAGGRQADQVEIGAPQQRQAVGPRRGGQAGVLPRGFEEAVDRVIERLRGRHRRLPRVPERPVVAGARRQLVVLERGQRVGGRRHLAGVPVRPLVDPGADRGELRVAQRIAGHRHGGLVETGHHPEQEAVLGPPRHDGRTLGTALQRAVAAAQIQVGELGRLAVAVPAGPLHDRADVIGEVDRLVLGAGGRRQTQHGRECHAEQDG